MKNCKICKKRTKYMYSMNTGLYCDKCKYNGISLDNRESFRELTQQLNK